MTAQDITSVGGPYFEDFEVGQIFDDAPSLTLTPGHAALHQAIIGDRLRLPLDASLAQRVTGSAGALAHPQLVCDVAIGQSTGPSERVRGNLFYRGLILQRQPEIGDTLTTVTKVVHLKQNKPKPSGSTGLVVMEIQTVDQHGRVVLDFFRCPMIPLRDGAEPTGHDEPIAGIPEQLDEDALFDAVPAEWDYGELRAKLSGLHFADVTEGTTFAVEGRETVTGATELARLTLNIARTHTDAGAGAHGRRLVYGGHTIGIACAHATRALPNLLTVVAWEGCDHLGPVFEGDILSTELTVTRTAAAFGADAGLVWLRARVRANRDGEDPADVLDWRFVGLMA